MSGRGSERDWWDAAGEPEPYTFSRERLRRKDVWETIDWLERELIEADLILRSDVRRRFVNLRSMLATLLPDDPQQFHCPRADCHRYFWSEDELERHIVHEHERPLAPA